jgi:hypothetical protein
MRKTAVLFLTAFSLSFGAHAGPLDFKTITCNDENAAAMAPAFLDITNAPDGNVSKVHFEMGNIEQVDPDDPENYRYVTASGFLSSLDVQDTTVLVEGSFGMKLQFDASSGEGLLSGPTDVNPVSGEYDGQPLQNYPVACTIENYPAKKKK